MRGLDLTYFFACAIMKKDQGKLDSYFDFVRMVFWEIISSFQDRSPPILSLWTPWLCAREFTFATISIYCQNRTLSEVYVSGVTSEDVRHAVVAYEAT